MKRTILILAGITLAPVAAYADLITTNYLIAGDGTLTTPYLANPSVLVDTFNSGAPRNDWAYTGDYQLFNNPNGISGITAAPYNSYLSLFDPTWYASLPDPTPTTRTLNVSFGGATYDYLGLFWGSIDQYNTIQFFRGGNSVTQVYTGSAATTPLPGSGNQTNPTTNLYVNFIDMPTFDAVRFTSTQFAFEFDNLAVGNQVPIPGAVLLGLLGLGVAGWRLRKSA